jgi:hypothetical protein
MQKAPPHTLANTHACPGGKNIYIRTRFGGARHAEEGPDLPVGSRHHMKELTKSNPAGLGVSLIETFV